MVSDLQMEQGLRRLLDAVDRQDDEPAESRLDEAYDLAHVAAAQWSAIVAQMRAVRHLTRRELKLPLDEEGQVEERLSDEGEVFATASRTFLRKLAATMVTRSDDVSVIAGELHCLIYGEGADEAPVTWQDYRRVLLGIESDEPPFASLQAAARLLREGANAASVVEQTGLSRDWAHRLSGFLGLKAWRCEAKTRAARVAAAAGWTAAQFAASYNERFGGLDGLSERSAREYLAAAREAA